MSKQYVLNNSNNKKRKNWVAIDGVIDKNDFRNKFFNYYPSHNSTGWKVHPESPVASFTYDLENRFPVNCEFHLSYRPNIITMEMTCGEQKITQALSHEEIISIYHAMQYLVEKVISNE